MHLLFGIHRGHCGALLNFLAEQVAINDMKRNERKCLQNI